MGGKIYDASPGMDGEEIADYHKTAMHIESVLRSSYVLVCANA